MSKEANHRGGMILLYALLAVIIFLLVFPLVYAVGGSSRSTEEFLLGGPKVSSEIRCPENCMKVWKQANFARYALNSVFFAMASVISIIIAFSMTGHAMSRYDFPGKELLTGTFGFMMFLVGAVTLFPIFQFCRKSGFLDSIWGMVTTKIATAQSSYYIPVMGYCNGVSKKIDETATIDSANFFKVYTTILVPIMKLIFATTGILAFRDAWDNYMMSLAFTLSCSELRPLTMGMVLLRNQDGGVATWSTMSAGTVVPIVLILIAYLSLNRYFIKGVTARAIKGQCMKGYDPEGSSINT